jgi:hypothetical protein
MFEGIDIPDMPNGKGKGCMIILWIVITIVIIAMHISSFN